MSRKSTPRRKDAEPQGEPLALAPSHLGDPALNPLGAPGPVGAKPTSPGQRPGNPANQNPPSPERAEQPELPEGWQIKRLGDLLRQVDVRQADLPESEAEGLEVLSLTKNDGLILQRQRFGKRIATEDTSKYKVVRAEQIVYNPYVIWEGAVHALRKYPVGLVSPVYPVWETCEADGGFIDYLLRTPQLIEAYNRVCSGAVNRRRSIREEDFTAIPVTVPDLQERRAIAGVLRTVQRAREACARVLAATRQLKQSLLHHLFTYGPVPFPQADHVPLQETEIGPMPEHWELPTFGEHVEVARGQVDPREKPYSAMLHVGPEHIESGSGRLLALSTAAETGLISGKYLFSERDVLYSKIRPYLRKAALPSFAGVCSADMYPLRPKLSLDRRFLFFWLLSDAFTRAIVPSQDRTGIPKVNRQQLNSTPLPLPPLSEQREIARQLAAVDAKLAALEARRAALDALFRSLLEHLMTGRLRLPEFRNARGRSCQAAGEAGA